MRMIKLLIIALLIIPLQQALADDGYQEWKKQALAELSTAPIGEGGATTFAYKDYSQKVRDLLDTRYQEAKAFTGTSSDDLILFWILGNLGQMLQGQYQHDLKELGKTYRVEDSQNQILIKEYQSYYRKALDLDDNPDAPDHLDHYMLTAIGTDVLAPPDIKEKAMKKKVMLTQQGNVIHPNQEWQSYEFLLGNYAEQKDYDNYLKTVNEMIERFPGSPRMEELLEYKRQAEAAIGKRDRETVLQDGEGVDTSASKPDEQRASQTEMLKGKAEEPPEQGEPQAERSVLLWALLGGGIAVVAVGAAFAARRRKRD